MSESSFGIAAPFAGWPRLLQASLCIGLLIATILLARYLLEIGRLSDERLPFGVISLEAPGTSAHARWIVERLGVDGVASVRRQTLLDFAFLTACALTLSLACTMISEATSGPMKAYGIMIAWAILLAGALDAVENVAMLRMLSGSFGSPWPQLATFCATLKFSIAFGAFAYIAMGLASLGWGWLSRR
ncbi:hypothetical protein [Caldimonas sp. KR1-144]|uniref:hypothetical protein n=1 Tax=Caldimonas sp. KR1-144 TaxID=3400911 RepID=UPI003C0FE9F8